LRSSIAVKECNSPTFFYESLIFSGTTKNITIEANEPELEFNNISEKIQYDASQFIDLRKATKMSSANCKEILLRILNVLNKDKFDSLTQLEQRNQKNLLSSKAIHETYETFIVLKKEVQHELKIFIEQTFSNQISKNQIHTLSKCSRKKNLISFKGNVIFEYNKNELREYNTLSASFELNKNRYKDDSNDQSLVQAKMDFRKIFEIKHLQDLIVMQNNHKTLKRKTQSVILNLRTAAENNKEGYSQETILASKIFSTLLELNSYRILFNNWRKLPTWKSSLHLGTELFMKKSLQTSKKNFRNLCMWTSQTRIQAKI